MIHNAFPEIRERYEQLPKAALRVTVRFLSPIVHYEPLHLDAMLSYAVVYDATRGEMLSGLSSGDAYYLPLPMQALWHSPSGLPLWASTDFAPQGEVVSDVTYAHKRALEPKMTSRNLTTGKGQFKEIRKPLPTIDANGFSADCVGNAEEIARLLNTTTGVGKKRAYGFGNVAEWIIEDIPEFNLYDEAEVPRRPLPAKYVGAWRGDIMWGGWTPPYWLASLHCPLVVGAV